MHLISAASWAESISLSIVYVNNESNRFLSIYNFEGVGCSHIAVKIGVLHLKGFMPCCSRWGFIVNSLVKRPEDVHRMDVVIVPSGDFRKVPKDMAQSIESFAEHGGVVIGVCDGVKVLANRVCRGTVCFEQLGLLDVVVDEGYRCEEVTVKIVEREWITRRALGLSVSTIYIGSCSSISVGRDARVVAVEYGSKGFPSIIVGARSNVVGILHSELLDRCRAIAINIVEAAGGSPVGVDAGEEFWKRMCGEGEFELGVDTGLFATRRRASSCKRVIVVTSTMEGEGKTVISTGIAVRARLMGFRAAIAKLGFRATDLYPSIYMLREPLDRSNAIAISWRGRRLGIEEWASALSKLISDRDLVVVEGFKGLFTGISMVGSGVTSTIEFISRSKLPVLLVTSAINGVEDAAIRASIYVDKLIEMGVEVIAVVMNRFDGSEAEAKYVAGLLDPIPVYFVPEDKELRNLRPEVDIHEFSTRAARVVSKGIDVESLLYRTPCYCTEGCSDHV